MLPINHQANGDQDDVMVRSTSEMKFQLKQNPGGSGKEGPIYLCVPNSALAELVDACPEERRQDLVSLYSCSERLLMPCLVMQR